MVKTVVTIVGSSPDAALENRAAQAVKETGVEDLTVETLRPGYAVDILVRAESSARMDVIREKLAVLTTLGPFDIFVQPNDEFRKKKLLITDMDATIIVQETLDELAAQAGLKDKIAPITQQAMRGEIDFQEALRLRVRLLKGLPVAALAETLRQVEYSSGAATLVKTMSRRGAQCVLVSGGFDFFTAAVAATLGFHKNFGNRLVVQDDRLTGEVVTPVLDKRAKERLVVEQARGFPCDLKHVVAVGDGANDIPMLQKAGVGVGYFGKPAVVAATPHQIRHTDLSAVLYMQGYRHSDFQ